MSIISRTADLFYTFKFLKLLVTPWNEMEAFELKIVDENGQPLKKASELQTDAEKSAYTPFHRLVFNIKRLLNKLPLGKSRIASYAAALYLIKEETGISDASIKKVMCNLEGIEMDLLLTENTWFLSEDGKLQPGTYNLIHDAILAKTGECRAYKGTKVDIAEATAPAGMVLGVPVFLVKHRETGQMVCVSTEDLTR